MTEPTKIDRNGCLALVGMIIGLSALLSMCSSLMRDPNVSSTQLKEYDNCVAGKQKRGIGVVEADGQCYYLRRPTKP